ncbi:MAG: DUF4296 domain-containing protein [Bacteroidota bacterium]
MTGCKEDAPPEGLLPISDMTEILQELHLIDAGVNKLTKIPRERDSLTQVYYDAVFRHLEVSREGFYNSYTYYLKEPELMDSIYGDILDNLNQRLPLEQERQQKRLGNREPYEPEED